MGRFGESVRWAVQNYVARTAEPSPNAVRREIAALHRAAERGEYERLAGLIEQLTPVARRILEERQAILQDRQALLADRRGRFARLAVPDWRIPVAAELRDPATCAGAAEGFEALLAFGTMREARERPSGKPTISLAPLLYAPRPSRAEPRTRAERELIMWLQVAVAEIGAQVTLTARAGDAG